MKQTFPEGPLMTYRRPRNLKDLLVKARLPSEENNKPPGSFNSSATVNVSSVGNIWLKAKRCISSQTNKSYPITQHMDCKSTWIIYLITCRKCNKQYIGKTTNTLYTRISNTRSQIKNFKTSQSLKLPYAQHFNLPNHSISDLALMPIEQIKQQSNQVILHRESIISHCQTKNSRSDWYHC